MIEGTFDVAVDTPKYHRRGTLALKSEGQAIEGLLTLTDHEPLRFTGSCADKEFDFEGNADIPSFGQADYQAHGSVWGNSIEVKCTVAGNKVGIFGTRLSTSAGELKSSHDYIMTASTGEFADNEATMYSGRYADGS